MIERIELRYVGICRGGPWNHQEIRAELPVIRNGLPKGSPPTAQYFHENGIWYWEPDPDGAVVGQVKDH